jgi:hypothetical protein
MKALRVVVLLFVLLASAALRAPRGRAQPADSSPGALAPDPLVLDDLSAFRSPGANWQVAGAAFANRRERRHLKARPGAGVLVNQPSEQAADNLFTEWTHSDLELELDVMMPKGSNSGLYLMGRYEVQLLDSWGVEEPAFNDLGGIYQRWDGGAPRGERGYHGQPPRVNVARAPGLWQHLRIVFQAPRFEDGRKVENARFDEVVLNGVVVQKNVEVTGPTRAAAFPDEQRTGPLMIQGDHGPVAFRNIRYRRLQSERVHFQHLRYDYYEGEFEAPLDLTARAPKREGVPAPLTQTVAERAAGFALDFRGRLQVPRSGRYRFAMRARNGEGRLTIDGRRVVDYDSTGGTVRLDAGARPFELTYFKHPQSWTEAGLALFVKGPAMPRYELTQPGSDVPLTEQVDPIYVEPDAERPTVLRSFLWHGSRGGGGSPASSRGNRTKRTSAVSVGSASGMHYAVDLGQAAPLYLWKGSFADATSMWHERGEAQILEPRGSLIPLAGAPSIARLAGPEAPWPDSLTAADDFAVRGYELDEQGRPAFQYRFGDTRVTDHFTPGPEDRVLTREVTFRPAAEEEGPAAQAKDSLWLRLATAERIRRLSDGAFSIGDRTYYVEMRDTGGGEPRVRRAADGRRELLLPVPLGDEKGDAVTRLRYDLVW